MQQALNPNGMPVVVLFQPPYIDKQITYTNMRPGLAQQLIGLGATQIVIGVMSIAFQIVSIVTTTNIFSISFDGHGIWCGVLFLITGPFGISGGKQKKRCAVITFNVMSIISACFGLELIGEGIAGALIFYSSSWYCDGYHYPCGYSGQRVVGVAMESILAILGLIEGIIAIWSSAVCCAIGACCCNCSCCSCCCPKSTTHTQLMTSGQAIFMQQPLVVANNGQSTGALVNQQQQPMIIMPNQLMPQELSAPTASYSALQPGSKDQKPYQGLYTGLGNTQASGTVQHDYYSSPYEEVGSSRAT